MESNSMEAIKIAVSVFVFIMALTVGLFLMTNLLKLSDISSNEAKKNPVPISAQLVGGKNHRTLIDGPFDSVDGHKFTNNILKPEDDAYFKVTYDTENSQEIDAILFGEKGLRLHGGAIDSVEKKAYEYNYNDTENKASFWIRVSHKRTSDKPSIEGNYIQLSDNWNGTVIKGAKSNEYTVKYKDEIEIATTIEGPYLTKDTTEGVVGEILATKAVYFKISYDAISGKNKEEIKTAIKDKLKLYQSNVISKIEIENDEILNGFWLKATHNISPPESVTASIANNYIALPDNWMGSGVNIKGAQSSKYTVKYNSVRVLGPYSDFACKNEITEAKYDQTIYFKVEYETNYKFSYFYIYSSNPSMFVRKSENYQTVEGNKIDVIVEQSTTIVSITRNSDKLDVEEYSRLEDCFAFVMYKNGNDSYSSTDSKKFTWLAKEEAVVADVIIAGPYGPYYNPWNLTIVSSLSVQSPVYYRISFKNLTKEIPVETIKKYLKLTSNEQNLNTNIMIGDEFGRQMNSIPKRK